MLRNFGILGRSGINAVLHRRLVNNVNFCTVIVEKETKLNYRKEHSIRIKGVDNETLYQPITSFDDSPFLQPIKTIMQKAGYVSPTPIQAQAWPIAMDKRDMISVAKTGSGKTCAYLLPAIHELMTNKKEWSPNNVNVFILAPTRELCLQIMEQVTKYTGGNSAAPVTRKFNYKDKFDRSPPIPPKNPNAINALACYGGSDRYSQISQLRRNNIQIVVGTPGRCNDLLEAGVLNLKNVRYCVLDEADRM